MKYLKQLMLILVFSFTGEVLKYFLPFPIPASIYGLVLLFAALETGIVKLGAVKHAAGYLIEIMPLMFIPAGAGLMDSWGALQPVFIPVAVITVLSTVAVLAVSGKVTQLVIRRINKSSVV